MLFERVNRPASICFLLKKQEFLLHKTFVSSAENFYFVPGKQKFFWQKPLICPLSSGACQETNTGSTFIQELKIKMHISSSLQAKNSTSFQKRRIEK